MQLPHHWSTVRNGASYGTDYFMRTAIAKSNILALLTSEQRTKSLKLSADDSLTIYVEADSPGNGPLLKVRRT